MNLTKNIKKGRFERINFILIIQFIICKSGI
jgi:hypothetical protein